MNLLALTQLSGVEWQKESAKRDFGLKAVVAIREMLSDTYPMSIRVIRRLREC